MGRTIIIPIIPIILCTTLVLLAMYIVYIHKLEWKNICKYYAKIRNYIARGNILRYYIDVNSVKVYADALFRS